MTVKVKTHCKSSVQLLSLHKKGCGCTLFISLCKEPSVSVAGQQEITARFCSLPTTFIASDLGNCDGDVPTIVV